jgi:hypothetical protein
MMLTGTRHHGDFTVEESGLLRPVVENKHFEGRGEAVTGRSSLREKLNNPKGSARSGSPVLSPQGSASGILEEERKVASKVHSTKGEVKWNTLDDTEKALLIRKRVRNQSPAVQLQVGKL